MPDTYLETISIKTEGKQELNSIIGILDRVSNSLNKLNQSIKDNTDFSGIQTRELAKNTDALNKKSLATNTSSNSNKGFTASVFGASSSLLSMANIIVAGYGFLATYAVHATAAAKQLTFLSTEARTSTSELQRLNNTMQAGGAGIDNVRASIASLGKSQIGLKYGEGDMGSWAILGIDPRQGTPVQLYQKTLARLKSMSNSQEAVYWGGKVGISEQEVMATRTGRNQSSAKILNDSQVSQLTLLNQRMMVMGQNIKYIFDSISVYLASFIASFGQVVQWVANFVGFLEKGSLIANGMKAIFVGLALTLGFMFAPIQTIIAIVLLLIDDVMAAFRGDKSIFGMLMNHIAPLRALVESLQAAFTGVVSDEDITRLATYASILGTIMAAVGALTGNIALMAVGGGMALGGIGTLIGQLIGDMAPDTKAMSNPSQQIPKQGYYPGQSGYNTDPNISGYTAYPATSGMLSNYHSNSNSNINNSVTVNVNDVKDVTEAINQSARALNDADIPNDTSFPMRSR